MRELRRNSQKLTEAPEPPCAIASAVVARPRTRSKAPKVKSAGRRLVEFAARAFVLDRAVRRIQ
jgi:hypothetical protein